jgi:hypothetical protein
VSAFGHGRPSALGSLYVIHRTRFATLAAADLRVRILPRRMEAA